jgi:hypothetical protein
VNVITAGDLGGLPADHFGWMKTPAPIAGRIADWITCEGRDERAYRRRQLDTVSSGCML